MAKIKILFCGTKRSETEENELEVYANVFNEIFISISSYDEDKIICLDRSTAIRLVRELKKQIGFIMESEDNHE